MNLKNKLNKEFIILDGGMGTELQKRGLKPGELPEHICINNPDAVTEIHKAYLSAGSDIISTNTFGANSFKYDDEELYEVISAAVNCAKSAILAVGGKKRYVALDIGPLGKMLKPLGDLDFENAVDCFAKTVKIGVEQGVDLIFIETMNDAYETKAAVLAAKENSDLPIFVTNVYDESGKLMTGASPEAMASLLEGLRVDAFGLNCSLGPAQMAGIVNRLVAVSSTPIIVKPNAGLPEVVNGKTHYKVTTTDFALEMGKIAKSGGAILGGCCGTTPEYIKALADVLRDEKVTPITAKTSTVISSYTKTLYFDKRPVLIGERINPTGKKAFKEALVNGDMNYILNEGIKQAEAGVDALDVNVGIPQIDEPEFIRRTVTELQAVTDLPLQIDTASYKALEQGLRYYNGKPLINSVSGKEESLNKVLPLAAKYGGVLIALTLDDSGIPKSAEERVDIAKKIIKRAEMLGIDKKDIIVDPLAMAVSADSSAGTETLKAIKILNNMGIKTSLGVSNISFGLPNRDFVTSTFFAMALENGLSAAIMNPYSFDMLKVYYSFLALKGLDEACKEYIDFAGKYSSQKVSVKATDDNPLGGEGLKSAIIKGLKDKAKEQAYFLLENTPPLEVINEHIVPALDEVGRGFEQNKVYLPQLLMSAEAATSAFDAVKTKIPATESGKDKKIIIATVKGDIHDIGKNIVKVLLQNYGFNVIDLGKGVPPEAVLNAAKRENARLVGLSALMTTTVPAMEETVKLLNKELPDVKTVVGGAVLTPDYAKTIGADYYGKSAMDTVRIAEKLLD